MSVECVCVWVMRVCVCAVSVCVCMSVTVWAVTPGLVHPDDPTWWSVVRASTDDSRMAVYTVLGTV